MNNKNLMTELFSTNDSNSLENNLFFIKINKRMEEDSQMPKVAEDSIIKELIV